MEGKQRGCMFVLKLIFNKKKTKKMTTTVEKMYSNTDYSSVNEKCYTLLKENRKKL